MRIAGNGSGCADLELSSLQGLYWLASWPGRVYTQRRGRGVLLRRGGDWVLGWDTGAGLDFVLPALMQLGGAGAWLCLTASRDWRPEPGLSVEPLPPR